MKKTIVSTLVLLFFLGMTSCSVLRIISLNKSDIPDRLIIHYVSDSSSGKSIILLGMQHVGRQEYYDNVRKRLDSLRTNGYVVFMEGTGFLPGTDSAYMDTLNRKFRRVTGFHLSHYMDQENKSMITYDSTKYTMQNYRYLGYDADSTVWIHADLFYPELIARYEADRGEIILTDYDWETPLNAKYRQRKSRGDTITHSKWHLLHTVREKHVGDMILASPHDRIVILYGASHLYHIIDRQIKDSLGLTYIHGRILQPGEEVPRPEAKGKSKKSAPSAEPVNN